MESATKVSPVKIQPHWLLLESGTMRLIARRQKFWDVRFMCFTDRHVPRFQHSYVWGQPRLNLELVVDWKPSLRQKKRWKSTIRSIRQAVSLFATARPELVEALARYKSALPPASICFYSSDDLLLYRKEEPLTITKTGSDVIKSSVVVTFIASVWVLLRLYSR